MGLNKKIARHMPVIIKLHCPLTKNEEGHLNRSLHHFLVSAFESQSWPVIAKLEILFTAAQIDSNWRKLNSCVLGSVFDVIGYVYGMLGNALALGFVLGFAL
jgi:hypothetical protein